MVEKPSSIRNLGPATDAVYASVGIHTADEIRALGPDEAYFKLLKSGRRPHFIAYYALVMGLQGRPWNDCQGNEKELLRQRFDGLKARLSPADTQRSEIEQHLDMLGIVKNDK
jgi:hypothetical protein